MTGLSQVSSAGNMPKNCGMEGMHGGAAIKQTTNYQHTEATHQNHTAKIPDQYRGQTVDIKV
ncbi:hypothetical protein CA600_28505 [Paenibacillus sp. VTT E-133280]|uniref:hypothetical protein n=1 Tax=unclassified Paenibacillus TaxID=185978 RepID=UPI000BA0C9D1|nr:MULTISPECIES: hypothetical protein [unclassified Paenibacillus]MBY3621391.1 hypothetical protein [Acinetobacter sp. CUI P1]MDH6372998.1 hypothetical protein [Paenibacillus sp. PastF-3]OZQ60335.1 hypothetical protein CA600_28505 [Paenibacillus sp. VTT E-133280]